MMKHTLICLLSFALLLPLALLCGGCAPSQPEIPAPQPEGDGQQGEEADTPPEQPEQSATTDAADTGYAEKQSTITDYLNVYGRTPVLNGGLTMFWTNSGFSFAFRGTGVTAKINTSTTNGTYYGYLNVYVDGATTPTSTVCVDKNGTYTLAADLPDGDHTIEVRKRNEAIYGDSATLTLKSLSVTNGEFCTTPPKTPKFTVEFIGDSITSGFGNMVSDGGGANANFSTHTQDGTMTYATIAARANRANASVLSRSGICYVTGSDRDSMYPYYMQTALLPGNGVDSSYWNFEDNEVDVVVINLGTNDTGARINGGAISFAQYRDLAYEFIKLVRAHNPDATIVWAYGMITKGGGDAIKAAVKQFNDEGDDEVHYCERPTMDRTSEGVGVHGHPDYLSHLISAVTLADFLENHAYLDLDYTTTLQDAVWIAQQYLPTDADALTEAQALLSDGCDSDEALDAVLAIIKACKESFTNP